MLGIAAAVTSSLASSGHPTPTCIPCATFSALDPRTLSPSNQLWAATWYKLTAFRVKAMAEALPNDKSLSDKFPLTLTITLSLKSLLRCGENPPQDGALYVDKSHAEGNAGGVLNAIQHHGETQMQLGIVYVEFSKPTCVIEKHENPCGVASRDDITEAYRLAVQADPVSAFGGIVAFNVEVDEIVVAPGYSKKGLEVLRGKSKKLRILEARKNNRGRLILKQVGGGWLAQEPDDLMLEDIKFGVVSEKAPQENELDDARFAWLCVKHLKSNAIVFAKNHLMLGMGCGQPNRLESLGIAMRKAGDKVKGAALASDAFFPFAWDDAVEEACKSGIGLIAEPGGSLRDADAIECCNQYGVSLVFSNVRHFRH